MSEFKRPENQAEVDAHFAPIHPDMNATMAYYESARCLFCYDAPCIEACPTGIDIPLFIRQINTGNVTGAAQTIFDANYFGHACGKVCPTEVLCEGACVYNHQDVKPIEIGQLQSFASAHAIENNIALGQAGEESGKKVAVVGAGPAGISCACELRSRGHQVDIFEAKSRPTGLLLHGNAPYKITNEEIERETAFLQDQFGFQIHYNRAMRTSADFRQLEDTYDAIFLAVGLGNTRRMALPGDTLVHSLGATEFIEQLKLQPLDTFVGDRVVVIGGGNTAMDAASECARMGAVEVTLAYRRSKADMGAYAFEYDLAKSVGVQGLFEVQPVEVLGTERVEGLRLARTQIEDGRVRVIADDTFDLPCDMVIWATGQQKQTGLFDMIGLAYDGSGKIQAGDSTYQCSKAMYFTAGDARNGGAEVVNACGEAKQAAIEIDNFLRG